MPYGRRYSRYRRRPYTRRPIMRRRRRFTRRRPTRRGGYNSVRITRPITSRKMLVRLRYCDQIVLDPGLASSAIYQFKANGMFDPDFTGTGHQPMGFDQWMTFYDHFTVVGSKITVKAVNNTTSAYTLLVALSDDTALSNPTTLAGFQERSGSRWTTLGPNTGNKGVAQVTSKFSAKKFFGTKFVVGESSYKGTSGSDPNELAMYHIVLFPFQFDLDNMRVPIQITIEYIAAMTEPIQQLAQS